jgi:hypothetical protein
VVVFINKSCNASKVSTLSFYVIDLLLCAHHCLCFVCLPHSDIISLEFNVALIQYYGWGEVMVLYTDNNYSIVVFFFLSESLINVGCFSFRDLRGINFFFVN